MILPDVNVLVYAFRTEAAGHAAYSAWLRRLLAGEDQLALYDPVLSGFVRIVTDRRIVRPPAPVLTALDFVDDLTAARRARWIGSAATAWERLRLLCTSDAAVAGRLVPDALLAAVATAHGAQLATADRGFARYPGLRFFDPAAT